MFPFAGFYDVFAAGVVECCLQSPKICLIPKFRRRTFLSMSSVFYLLETLVAICTLLWATIVFFKWNHRYWERKGLPQLTPSIPMGNLDRIFPKNTYVGQRIKDQYFEIKRNGWRHAGIYFVISPVYFPADLDFVRNIMTKDSQYFTNPGSHGNEKDDPIGAQLFAMEGPKWRPLRAKLTPTFTSGKMTMMFQTLVDCRHDLDEAVAGFCQNKQPIDIGSALECFTADVIGYCAFGLESNSFKEENAPLKYYGKRAFIANHWEMVQIFVSLAFPDFARSLGIRQNPKEVADFFTKVVTDTVEYRERNSVNRKDFLQVLIDLKNGKTEGKMDVDEGLTLEEVIAQCYVFFLGGFVTSATTMTFALYEMAKNQEIQQKVRKEIEEVLPRHGGRLTYDAVNDLKYMGQVIDETLRMYPPLPFYMRQCVKDYRIPETDITIDKGTKVLIPVWGIQMDPEFYHYPEEFDPGRFSEENKQSRERPYTHMPFGEGPSICIGLRFGLMQTKVGLATLLRTYSFTLDEKTSEPLKMEPNSFSLAAKDGVWLNVHKA